MCNCAYYCTGVAIEISLAKDRSLSVVITGKEEAVKMARKLVLQQLQTQVVMVLCHLDSVGFRGVAIGGISVCIPPKSVYLIFMWLFSRD